MLRFFSSKEHRYFKLTNEIGKEFVIAVQGPSPSIVALISSLIEVPMVVDLSVPFDRSVDGQHAVNNKVKLDIPPEQVYEKWDTLVHLGQRIRNDQTDYDLQGPNSNTFVRLGLERLGVDPDSLDNDLPGEAPGDDDAALEEMKQDLTTPPASQDGSSPPAAPQDNSQQSNNQSDDYASAPEIRTLGKVATTLLAVAETVPDTTGEVTELGDVGGGIYGAIVTAQAHIGARIAALTAPTGPAAGSSPIALDLNGDGTITLVKADRSTAHFDFNGDGFAERSGWVGPNDGILVYDRNGDGLVSTTNEIVFTGYRAGARTDLEGLRAFDSNADGRLSSADARWTYFKVWRDANQNGISEAGEMQTLAALSLASLSLTRKGSQQTVEGNTVHGHTHFAKSDGSQMLVWDTQFAITPGGIRIVRNGDRITLSIKARDGSVTSIGLLTGDTGRTLSSLGTLGGLIGTEQADSFTHTGSNGVVIISGGGNDTIRGGASHDVLIGGADADHLYGRGGNDILVIDAGDTVNGGTGRDIAIWGSGTAARVALVSSAAQTVTTGYQKLVGIEHFIGGVADDQVETRTSVSVTIEGRGGNDTLKGGSGNDVIKGGAGDDRLFGNAGDDQIYDGSGNDVMTGGPGDDTFHLTGTRGLAKDIDRITDFGTGRDRLAFDLDVDEVWVRIEGGTTKIIAYSTALGRVTHNLELTGFTTPFTPTHLVDSDITIRQASVMGEAETGFTGTAVSDVVIGNARGTTIDAGAGDDRVFGGDGNDLLWGRSGNDYLYGGDGNDGLSGHGGRDILVGGRGRDTFYFNIDAAPVTDATQADRVLDFKQGGDADKISISHVTNVWYRHVDVDGDGTTDTVLYDNATGSGGIHAVLMDFDDTLTASDFLQPGTILAEIV